VINVSGHRIGTAELESALGKNEHENENKNKNKVKNKTKNKSMGTAERTLGTFSGKSVYSDFYSTNVLGP
jgi:hypothetical protein